MLFVKLGHFWHFYYTDYSITFYLKPLSTVWLVSSANISIEMAGKYTEGVEYQSTNHWTEIVAAESGRVSPLSFKLAIRVTISSSFRQAFCLNLVGEVRLAVRQWVWHSGQCSCFPYHMVRILIQSLAVLFNIYLLSICWKEKSVKWTMKIVLIKGPLKRAA